jgi:protein DGCR14
MSFDDESPMSTPSAHAITSRELVPLPRNNSAMVVLGARKLQTPKETRTVLKEEKYLDQLETIIQRDYYPDVPKLRAQLEYANAVDVNDVAKIRELQLRYSTMKRTDRRTSPTMRRGSPELFDPDQTPAGAHDDPDANKEGDNDAVIR